jgi:putative Mg2+ transporter-C (MgtC) family protein
MIDDGTIAIRLVIAAALGGILGIEREIRDRPAGLRTHILVGTGSCLFAIVSAYGFQEIVLGSPSGQAAPVRADITRVASQIVVGIGFLGAGTIIRYRGRVSGLTTAAGLWIAAAVGLAVGIGMVVPAIVTVGIGLASFIALKPFADRLGGKGDRVLPESDDEQDEDDTGPSGQQR